MERAVTLSALAPAEIAHRLSTDGLYLQTGGFQLCIQSPMAALAVGIGRMYADYSLGNVNGFTDFRVRLAPPAGVRRWFRKQVVFAFDGTLPFKPLPSDQVFPMLEWGLNWCVSSYANSYLIIHAAVIEKNGCAAILPAPPGSGKSTLCAALINRGWRLLSDELTLVSLTDGRIVPLPRPVSLKNASIDIIRAYAPAAVFTDKVFDTVKGTVAHMKPPVDSVVRGAETAYPAWIIFPKYAANAQTMLTPMSPAKGFLKLADNAFNYSSLGTHGFEAVAGLMDRAECYDFTYSQIDEAIACFDALTPRAHPR